MSHYFRSHNWLWESAALLVMVLISPSCSTPQASNAIRWQGYDPAVLEQARGESRPVILEFSADWCPPCKELDERTFSDQRIIESSMPFVLVQVDVTDWESSESLRIKEKFGVTGVPEILFLDGDGQEITELRVIGFLGPDYFLRRMQFAARSVLTLSAR